jgi:hypothetical protein
VQHINIVLDASSASQAALSCFKQLRQAVASGSGDASFGCTAAIAGSFDGVSRQPGASAAVDELPNSPEQQSYGLGYCLVISAEAKKQIGAEDSRASWTLVTTKKLS